MTHSVTLNGNAYNDGDVPPGNMGAGGHRDNLIPMLSDGVIDLAAKQAATEAAAVLAINAPGTSATSATSITVGTGAITFALAQAGKAFAPGQTVVLARTSAPGTRMIGVLTAFNSATGAATVNFQSAFGSGTFTDWTLSLTTSARPVRQTTTVATSTTPTPNADTDDVYVITALASAATLGAPAGTPSDGQALLVRIRDNGASRALAYNTAYRASTDLLLPASTVANKTLYLGFNYNATAAKWDLVAVLNNF
ncbi:hypothetical protein GTP38_23355 [Duganella sp. FT94W]|uniref:Uncharacterized protein n=1 Tax=Duganella lactea TaxID=2692173 RepID=A0ABW9VF98_9BURK|nr:hypothetical protein [Duganella lactea]MYM37268.1 hypothetical protein [Duganella lactea]